MSLSNFFRNIRRYNANAAVIFDHAEPIGRATDLVMPRRRWFRRRTGPQTVTSPSLPTE